MGRLNKKDITLGKDLRVGNEWKKIPCLSFVFMTSFAQEKNSHQGCVK